MKRLRKPALAVVLATAVCAVLAAAANAAAPQNTAPPTISGTAKEGSTLTAQDGTWTNTPTSFTYQWQRCASDGTGCGDINGAAAKTYTPVAGDVGHALKVVVTAVNADGRTPATSGATDPVNSKNGPSNSVKPALSGSAVVGETLTVSNGSWSTTPTSFARQWQRCAADGTDCLNVSGATGQTYGVRSGDVGHRIRALVTARTSGGSTTVATNTSAVVTGSSTTTTTTTTVTGNKAPSIKWVSLRIRGASAYARFRVCDDRPGRVKVIARDTKNRAVSASHRFRVSVVSCAAYSRHWRLASRFRTSGRYVATLRAVDAQGRLSLVRSRSLVLH
jgi:hypothetical protein